MATVVLVVLALALDGPIAGLEVDALRASDILAPSTERLLHGLIEWIGVLVVLAVWIGPLALRRYRVFAYVAIAGVVAALLAWAVLGLIDGDPLDQLVDDVAERVGVDRAWTTSSALIAHDAAAFIALGPFVGLAWRRAGRAVLATLVALRLLVSFDPPIDVIVALPLGAAVGAGVLLGLGRPDRRATPQAIRDALVETALPVVEVRAAKVDARGSTPYFATVAADRPAAPGSEPAAPAGLFVKVLGQEERAADLLFRAYRFLRLKDVGDERPFSSLRRAVEHEALVALAARDVGVRTPRMRKVARVGDDALLLAYDMIDGRSLDALAPDEVTDEIVTATFDQLAILRQQRIAHRDLRLANVFVTPEGEVWLIDFGFAELAADDRLLDADLAQLLASFGVVAGAERPVAAAVAVLGREAVADALPRLQLPALSGATQTALRADADLLPSLQEEVRRRTGVDAVELVPLVRIDRRTAVATAVVVAATYVVLTLLSDPSRIGRAIAAADWEWSPLLVLTTTLTFVGATISLAGAVPSRARAGPLFLAQVAGAFAVPLAPGRAGAMALKSRLLQAQGVDPDVATSAVGLDALAGVAARVSLIAVFVVWAGASPFHSIDLPDLGWYLLGLAIALGLVVIALAVPATRRHVTARQWPFVRRGAAVVGRVARRPAKLAALAGGATLGALADIVSLFVGVLVFGGELPLATVGVVYLLGWAVAVSAPTPGGLGIVEAVLVGGLVAAGLDAAAALPAVFVFRLATFWLPIAPGWLAFRWLQRRAYL